MANQSKDDTKTGGRKKPSVFLVCYLPYLSQDAWLKPGLLEELDSNLACDNTDILLVCFAE
jgi:hypothetical protein